MWLNFMDLYHRDFSLWLFLFSFARTLYLEDIFSCAFFCCLLNWRGQCASDYWNMWSASGRLGDSNISWLRSEIWTVWRRDRRWLEIQMRSLIWLVCEWSLLQRYVHLCCWESAFVLSGLRPRGSRSLRLTNNEWSLSRWVVDCGEVLELALKWDASDWGIKLESLLGSQVACFEVVRPSINGVLDDERLNADARHWWCSCDDPALRSSTEVKLV